MKSRPRRAAVFGPILSVALVVVGLPALAASVPPGFGNSLEQVVKSGAKEGRVNISASLEGQEIAIVLEGFRKRYPEIEVDYTTTTGVDSGEKILTESLAGHVEYDVAKIVYELQSKFVKAGVLGGPFALRLLRSSKKRGPSLSLAVGTRANMRRS